MNKVLQVECLRKTYENNTVIKDISFDVNKGEIFGLLGTNGAGKTTTLECIEGIRKYEKGNITLQGKIGVQLQSSSLPSSIKAVESIKLFSKWNRVPIDLALMETFGLTEFQNKQYKEMSTGQKRRLHLALAMIGDPDIIFLDEPTAGLDVEGRVSLHTEIRKAKQLGKTIILASHDMAEVESLCDRIIILNKGMIAFCGTANELTLEIGGQSRIYIKTSKPLRALELNSSQYEGEEQGYSIFLADSISAALLVLLTMAKEQNITVLDIKIQRATLEQKFMDITMEVKS